MYQVQPNMNTKVNTSSYWAGKGYWAENKVNLGFWPSSGCPLKGVAVTDSWVVYPLFLLESKLPFLSLSLVTCYFHISIVIH